MHNEAEKTKTQFAFDPTAPGYWTPGAAWYLGRAQVTLRKWRCQGEGPEFRLINGRAYYDRETLAAWVHSHASCRSTSAATVALTAA